nr:MAG: hypothetical protein DIU62_05710 [Pseudomonadota bacterium]
MTMRNMQCIDPIVGDWYRSHGQVFEVIAVDETEGVVEVQHADGSLEEIDLDDWATRCRAGSLWQADAPDDPASVIDREDEDDYLGVDPQRTFEEARGLRADALPDLDLFE